MTWKNRRAKALQLELLCVFILTTLLHVIAFGIAAVDLQYLGARMVLFFVAIPVLGLHLAVWAAARFLPLPWTVLAAIALNALWAAGGLAWWASVTLVDPIPWRQAVLNAVIFAATGMLACALLIAWVRAMMRRRLAAKG
jgi:hypothetical protein